MNFSLGVKENPLHLSRPRAGHLSGERSRCFDDPRPHHCSAASRQSPGILTTAWLHFVLLCKALHLLGWEVQAQDRVSSLPSSPAASLPPRSGHLTPPLHHHPHPKCCASRLWVFFNCLSEGSAGCSGQSSRKMCF